VCERLHEIFNKAISSFGSCSDVLIDSCMFLNCSSPTSGGSISLDGNLGLTVQKSGFWGCYSGKFGGGVYSCSTRNSIALSCFVECSAADPVDDSGHAAYLTCKLPEYTTHFTTNSVTKCPIPGIGRDSCVLVGSSTQQLSKSNFTLNKVLLAETFQTNSPTNLPACLNSFVNCSSAVLITMLFYGEIEMSTFCLNTDNGHDCGILEIQNGE